MISLIVFQTAEALAHANAPFYFLFLLYFYVLRQFILTTGSPLQI